MLAVENLDASFGLVQVLRGVTFSAAAGEVTCLAGRNGAGKTTTLKAIMGLVARPAGRVVFEDKDISRFAPHEVPRQGIGYVPQGRRLFTDLTVAENLEIGLMAGPGDPRLREDALKRFPVLRDRLDQRSGTLSGGEQQMLAIARALCLSPKLILMDEPTEGLQPSMVAEIKATIDDLRAAGVGIVLVEQHIDTIRALADRVVFLEHGACAEVLTADAIAAQPDLFERYLGISG